MTMQEQLDAYDFLAAHPEVTYRPPYHGIGCGAFIIYGEHIPTNSSRLVQFARILGWNPEA